MPMLNWMGREKAAKATKDVVMKILREEKSLGYSGGSQFTATEDGRNKLRPSQGTILGIHDGVAYALLYNGILHDRSVNGGNVLTRQTPYDVVTRR